jgi:hypothetical protein
MKWLDRYRHFGTPGQVLYLVRLRHRRILARCMIAGFGFGWGLMILGIGMGEGISLLGVCVFLGMLVGLSIWARLKGRRVELGRPFRSTARTFNWRGALIAAAIWVAGLALFWLILKMRP